jgi:ribosomal protein L20A (L18A)
MPINPNYNFLNGDAAFGEQAFRGGMALWGGPQEQAPRATPYIPGGLSDTDIEAVNAARQPIARPMQAPRPAQRMAPPAPMAAPVAALEFPIPSEPPGLVAPRTNIIEEDLPPEPQQPEMQTRILPPQEPALPQGFENTEIAKRGQAMGMDPRQILVALAEFSAGLGNIKGQAMPSTARSFYEMQKKYEQQNRDNAMRDMRMAQPARVQAIDPLTQQYKQTQIDYLKSKMQPKPAEAPRQVDPLSEDYKRAQIENLRARTKAMGNDGQLPVSVGGTDQTSPKAVKMASELRKEYQNNAVTKTSRDVKTQWAKVKEVMDNPSAAGDMAAIFMFMKTLDPGSTVREGEYKSAAEATSALGRVQTSLLQAKSGDKLNPAQRADFRKVMEKFYRAQMKEQARVNKQYSDLAGRQGINPADLMIEDVDSVQSEPGTPRKVRSVNDLPDVR